MTNAANWLENTQAAQAEAVSREKQREFEKKHRVWLAMRQATHFQAHPDSYVESNTMKLVAVTDALSSQIKRHGLDGYRIEDLNRLYERLQKKYWGKVNRVFQGTNTEKKQNLLYQSIWRLRTAMESCGYSSYSSKHAGSHIVPGKICFSHFHQFSR